MIKRRCIIKRLSILTLFSFCILGFDGCGGSSNEVVTIEESTIEEKSDEDIDGEYAEIISDSEIAADIETEENSQNDQEEVMMIEGIPNGDYVLSVSDYDLTTDGLLYVSAWIGFPYEWSEEEFQRIAVGDVLNDEYICFYKDDQVAYYTEYADYYRGSDYDMAQLYEDASSAPEMCYEVTRDDDGIYRGCNMRDGDEVVFNHSQKGKILVSPDGIAEVLITKDYGDGMYAMDFGEVDLKTYFTEDLSSYEINGSECIMHSYDATYYDRYGTATISDGQIVHFKEIFVS